MRSLPFAVTASLFLRIAGAQAQPVEIVPPVEERLAEAEAPKPDAEPATVMPVLSEPLPAIATGAPMRLGPPKSYAKRPAATPENARPLSQARPR